MLEEASYLASVFENVYFDLSLVPLIVPTKMEGLYKEALLEAPTSKILFGTDGHSIPESHWFGALNSKRGLSGALSTCVEDGFFDESKAYEIADQILIKNTAALYKLGS